MYYAVVTNLFIQTGSNNEFLKHCTTELANWRPASYYSFHLSALQRSGELDTVEGVALAIGKVGVRARGPPISLLRVYTRCKYVRNVVPSAETVQTSLFRIC